MNTRDRFLAVLLIALIGVGVAGAAGYLLVYEPVQEKTAAAATLDKEVADLTAQWNKFTRDRKRLDEVKRRSLPADEPLAKQEYNDMLIRLVRRAGIPPGFTVTPNTSPDARGVPLLPGNAKKPAYTKVVSTVEFSKADMWAVRDFLEGYYKLNLLHQITNISISRKEDAAAAGGRPRAADTRSASRKDLTVKLTTEAIILDGAENRRTLLPVSRAFAAVGGMPGYSAVADTPEVGRGLTPLQLAPVLAARTRDYSYLAVKDIFHGPLPAPKPLSVERITDVAVKQGDPVGPVKVPLGGEMEYLGEITLKATAGGRFLPPEALVVDQEAGTLTITPPEGESGSDTVTVVAKSEFGQEAKTSFRFTVDPPKVVAKEDISGAVRLIGVSLKSDGTATAIIRDDANRAKYEVEATRRRVKVVKYFYAGTTKKKDPEYDSPDELVIADDSSSTNRRFKVVAVDEDALIVQDLKPAEVPPPKPAGKDKGGRDKGKENEPAKTEAPAPKAGSDAPVEGPPLYRWSSGKSLAKLVRVPADEADRILRKAAEAGPVGATAVAATAPPPAGE